ncbi:MAG TPA: alpha/beta fold hydrolase [Plantibacter sp.]|uniref:alpha/beta fold hydrolase n=1 Tax=unclassified Plantibacter TaxID=2624265 RepID=UPI002BAAFD94|nr:alpha/beta fold hydrolase [Plantibacter sp.]
MVVGAGFVHDDFPTAGLPELPAEYSRRIDVAGVLADAGTSRSWHYLDTVAALAEAGATPVGTILAVHGNPTWSYLWRSVVTQSVEQARSGGTAWRIVAVDQLEMGWSERTDLTRGLEQRIADLAAFTDAIGLDGPVVTLGHDWGGVISLGWATEHPDLLVASMLLNTAVHHPEGTPIPAPLRLAGARGMLSAGSVRTTAFLDTTLSLASPKLTHEVRDAYRSPYASHTRRRGIGAFVADIPATPGHRSFPRLERLAADVAALRVPAVMLWGPRDPIFSDRYLDDLAWRLPHAQVHRFSEAGHLVIDDAPVAASLLSWLDEHVTTADPASPVDRVADFEPLWRRLDDRSTDDGDAIVEQRGTGAARRVSWRQLDDRVTRLAAGLHRIGVRRGDRVSLLVTPGATLTAVIYACLRIGAVVVVADAGLGVSGLHRAVRGAWPSYIIGETRGLTAARALGWPGVKISAARLPRATAAALGVSHSLKELLDDSVAPVLPAEPGPSDPAAILYTSGSTGPAKGVAYTHAQLSSLRDVLSEHFGITSASGLVTGFAPFALLGPALGARSSTPEMDISAPRTLTARAVAAAVAETSADIVFLSPAAILNVVATADALDAADHAALQGVRTVLSTGAPVSRQLLTALIGVLPNASAHAVYGMTECLLVSDITLDTMPDDASAAADSDGAAGTRAHAGVRAHTGVCVGTPIGGVSVRISALDAAGDATGAPSEDADVLGEVIISADHLKSQYDRLWLTDRAAVRDVAEGGRWHRTGDVGHLDEDGRLWIEGRLPHVITTQDGPLAPVGPEQDIETVRAVRRAAVVGVGPAGLRQCVAIVETDPASKRVGLADAALAAAVRAASSQPLVAVFAIPDLPTDIRHNSKIDRARLSAWAERVLAGERLSTP